MDYSEFLSTACRRQWERIGLKRRSGVAVALFSLYSADSCGLGEFPDLKLLVDWCKLTGMSIIQLLPLNDTGFNFRPYDSESTFALEPMYVSIKRLIGLDISLFKSELNDLRKNFPTAGMRVNYKLKQAKLELLWKIFKGIREFPVSFQHYIRDNGFWLEDYCLFKAIKENNNHKHWESWDSQLKQRALKTVESFRENNLKRIEFYQWLQWQLYEQLKSVKNYAEGKGVLLMGDLPFLVSRDSADVWQHQGYFKLDCASGAPSDMYFANGQRWGMPPYNWEAMLGHNYDYLKEKLRYAQNFYDFFRIDHAVGMFRIWTIPLSEPLENGGLNGTFEPQDEGLWEGQGRKLLSMLVENTRMLPCAEDLGVVPECSNRVLAELGIVGMEVQRWARDWGKTYDFKAPEAYRKNSIATLATHDSSCICGWWEFEAGTVDEMFFKRKCLEKGVSFEALKHILFDLQNSFHGRLRWRDEVSSVESLLDFLNLKAQSAQELIGLYKESYGEKNKFRKFLGMVTQEEGCSSELIHKALEKVNNSASIFSIQLLQDWLSLDCWHEYDIWEFRINFPGILSEKNWSIVMPLSLEEMLYLPFNSVIKNINMKADRI